MPTAGKLSNGLPIAAVSESEGVVTVVVPTGWKVFLVPANPDAELSPEKIGVVPMPGKKPPTAPPHKIRAFECAQDPRRVRVEFVGERSKELR